MYENSFWSPKRIRSIQWNRISMYLLLNISFSFFQLFDIVRCDLCYYFPFAVLSANISQFFSLLFRSVSFRCSACGTFETKKYIHLCAISDNRNHDRISHLLKA